MDLGGFRQYVHRHATEQRVTWGVEMVLSDTQCRAVRGDGQGRPLSITVTCGLPLDSAGSPIPRGKAVLQSYEIRVEGEPFLRMSSERRGRLQLDELTSTFLDLIWEYARADLAPGSRSPGEIDFQEAASRVLVRPLGLSRMQRITPEPGGADNSPWNENCSDMDRQCARRRIGWVATSRSTAELGRLNIWGTLRSYPPRHIAFTQQDDPQRGGRRRRASLGSPAEEQGATRCRERVEVGSGERLR